MDGWISHQSINQSINHSCAADSATAHKCYKQELTYALAAPIERRAAAAIL